jgi:uncharacterized protein YcfL
MDVKYPRKEPSMRQLALASLAVLALVGCSSTDDLTAAPAGSGSSVAVPPINPIDSAGRSDATTSGSASNTASGSTVTQRAAPGLVR